MSQPLFGVDHLPRYDREAIRSLKDEVDSDLYTSGSGTLVRALLADGLVDELHLFVTRLPAGRVPGSSLRTQRPATCRS